MDSVKRLVGQLSTLLDDEDFKSELKAFRSAYQRMRIRFRNNHLTAKLKQLATTTRQLHEKFSVDIIMTYANQLDNKDKKKLKRNLKLLLIHIRSFIDFLEDVLRQTLYVYGYTQQHFRVGHLVHHFIVLRTCISRYRICMKALLVYSCDTYVEIAGLDLVDSELKKDEIDEILTRHECKPRNLSAVIKPDQTPQPIDSQDQVGELIDRDTMKVGRSAKKKIKLK